VGNYWNVVLARENLTVRGNRWKKPRRVTTTIKGAESGCIAATGYFTVRNRRWRRGEWGDSGGVLAEASGGSVQARCGADLDPAIRVLDLDLTDRPEPTGELPSTDILTALARALANRPELERVHELLANDELSVRLAHNKFEARSATIRIFIQGMESQGTARPTATQGLYNS